MKFTTDVNELLNCPVPPSTETYTAVPHIDIHNKIVEILGQQGIDIIRQEFKVNKNCKQAIGVYHLDVGDLEFNGMLASRNSYDKTRSVAIVAGTSVGICENGCVMGEMKFLHKHVGKVDELFVEAIEEQIGKIQDAIDATRELKTELEPQEVDYQEIGSILGNLYLRDILNTTQLEIVKKELEDPTYVYGTLATSLWTIFNHITHSLKTTHPSSYFETHHKLVDYFKTFYFN